MIETPKEFAPLLQSPVDTLRTSWMFTHVPGGAAVQKLPPPIRAVLVYGLAQAA
jgi:hypothetical protein